MPDFSRHYSLYIPTVIMQLHYKKKKIKNKKHTSDHEFNRLV